MVKIGQDQGRQALRTRRPYENRGVSPRAFDRSEPAAMGHRPLSPILPGCPAPATRLAKWSPLSTWTQAN